MKIGFIGAGRVGCTLGKMFREHGISVSGYYSRTKEHAEEAAQFTDTSVYESLESLSHESDALFLTVSDNSIISVFQELDKTVDLTGKIICHTSGAMSSEVFSSEQQIYCYSIHPMYAVSDRFETYKNFQKAFITIEGAKEKLQDMQTVFDVCGMKYTVITARDKAVYHAASVFSSNYVCALFATSVDLLTRCGFEKDDARVALSGLFLGNAIGTAEKGPELQLTGPIERCDTATVEKHLASLPETYRDLYLSLARRTLDVAKEKNKTRGYSDMENLLKEEK